MIPVVLRLRLLMAMMKADLGGDAVVWPAAFAGPDAGLLRFIPRKIWPTP
jgi:hypothetical protein